MMLLGLQGFDSASLEAADEVNAKMVKLESRKAELEQLLADAEEPPLFLHPEMARFYREQVGALHAG